MSNSALIKLELPKSRAQAVTQRLREAIIDGELKLGEFIAEERLASMFGVSRTPVREALSQLQLQGLVVVRPQVGSFVFQPTAADIRALCEYRIVLEPQAAVLAFRHNKAATVVAMERALAAMTAAVAKGNTVAYGRADTAFHEGVFASCGNPHMVDAYGLVGGRIAALRTSLSAPLDVKRPQSYQQHRSLLRAFTTGDLTAYSSLMKAHIAATERTYTAALDSPEA